MVQGTTGELWEKEADGRERGVNSIVWAWCSYSDVDYLGVYFVSSNGNGFALSLFLCFFQVLICFALYGLVLNGFMAP